MGCLFAMFGGLFPRLALLVLWIARPALVAAAFHTFILPLLGIIFLPFTTLIYVIVYVPGVGLTGWGLFWVILALVLDVGHWEPATLSGVSCRGVARESPATRANGDEKRRRPAMTHDT